MKKLILFCWLCFALPTMAQTLVGSWKGELKTPQASLPLNFHFKFDEGVWSGTLDSPSQGAFDIPLSQVDYQAGKLKLSIAQLQLSLEGTVKEQVIDATYKQGLFTQAIQLTKTTVAKPQRPQTPQAPFPYQQEEVSFNSSQEEVKLKGTLSLPSTQGKFPAMILLAGSGPLDRDENVFGHKPFAVLADYFTRKGFAVLRYDKRGIGESSGDFANATTLDFAEDAAAAFEFLQTHPQIQAEHIGLIGHSEGGIIAPILAAENKAVQYVVLLAAPGVNGKSLLIEQQEDLLHHKNIPNELKTALINCHTQLNSYLFNQGMQEDFQTNFSTKVAEIVSQNKLEEIYPPKAQDGIVAQLSSPWYINFLRLDPAHYLKNIHCPILALNGEKDLQVAADTNLKAIQRAVSDTNLLTVKKYPKLNHLFQTTELGTVEEYYQIEETFSEAVLQDIYQWISKL